MRTQKGFATIAAIIIGVVVIGGVLYQSLWWETYTNEEYGFSFKHPPAMTAKVVDLAAFIEALGGTAPTSKFPLQMQISVTRKNGTGSEFHPVIYFKAEHVSQASLSEANTPEELQQIEQFACNAERKATSQNLTDSPFKEIFGGPCAIPTLTLPIITKQGVFGGIRGEDNPRNRQALFYRNSTLYTLNASTDTLEFSVTPKVFRKIVRSFEFFTPSTATEPSNFEECAAAGGGIKESYPRQCAFHGKNFVEQINAKPPTESELEGHDPRFTAILARELPKTYTASYTFNDPYVKSGSTIYKALGHLRFSEPDFYSAENQGSALETFITPTEHIRCINLPEGWLCYRDPSETAFDGTDWLTYWGRSSLSEGVGYGPSRDDLDRLGKLETVFVGEKKIIGRDTECFDFTIAGIEPQPTSKSCFDMQSGMLLEASLYDNSGTLLPGIVATELHFNPLSPSVFALPRGAVVETELTPRVKAIFFDGHE